MGGASRGLIRLKASAVAPPQKRRMQRILLFVARGLAILGIGFISLFALDVFGLEGSLAWRLGGFLVHLAPSFVLTGLLAVAWRWPGPGGALFIAAGLSPLFLLSNPVGVNLLLGGPFLLAGAAFIAGSQARRMAG